MDQLRINIPSTDRPAAAAEPQPEDPQNQSQAQWTHVRYSQQAWHKLKDKVLVLTAVMSCRALRLHVTLWCVTNIGRFSDIDRLPVSEMWRTHQSFDSKLE